MYMKVKIILLAMCIPVYAMAQRAIDVHCHNVFPEFVQSLEKQGAAMNENYPLPQWDVASHLMFMEEED